MVKGNFAYFAGNFGKYFLETLWIVEAKQQGGENRENSQIARQWCNLWECGRSKCSRWIGIGRSFTSVLGLRIIV